MGYPRRIPRLWLPREQGVIGHDKARRRQTLLVCDAVDCQRARQMDCIEGTHWMDLERPHAWSTMAWVMVITW